MRSSVKGVLAMWCAVGLSLLGGNPLGFREYGQQFRLQFGSEAEARAAMVKVRPLPRHYVLACSSRWDDSTPSHLRTHEVMRRQGVPGTFFLGAVGGVLRSDPEYLRKLLTAGCSVGLHTVRHPQLPHLDSFAHFEEYMANRIELETASQTAVNSQVLPFCGWNAECELVPASIGWAMRAVGVISSPDVVYPDLGQRLGYPAGTFAMSRFIAPGDREPDVEKMRRGIEQALRDTRSLERQPSISMAMHSWHTKEGLEKLNQCYALLAGHADWWYCNQTEYGAYRYEAQNATVTTAVEGKDVVVTVTRMEPFELGDSVPLWFSVNQAVPRGVTGEGASWKEGAVELAHGAGHALPTLFGRMGDDGKPDARLPFAALRLRRAGLAFRAELENLDGAKALEQVAFTFRFPAAYASETLRREVSEVGAGASAVAEVTQASRREELYFRYGRPYYAVQADFVRDGVRCRLYASLREERASGLPKTVNDVVSFHMAPEQADYASLSRPGASLSGLAAVEGVSADPAAGTGVIYPRYRDWGLRKKVEGQPTVLVAEMRLPTGEAGKVELATSAIGKGCEMWLNGQRLTPAKRIRLSLQAGRNRILLRTPGTRAVTFFLNGEERQSVEFLPLEAR